MVVFQGFQRTKNGGTTLIHPATPQDNPPQQVLIFLKANPKSQFFQHEAGHIKYYYIKIY
jgi:hypothetical protein